MYSKIGFKIASSWKKEEKYKNESNKQAKIERKKERKTVTDKQRKKERNKERKKERKKNKCRIIQKLSVEKYHQERKKERRKERKVYTKTGYIIRIASSWKKEKMNKKESNKQTS